MARRVPRGLQKEERTVGVAGYLFLVFPATTFCLGVWQYNRRNWKIQKISELEEKVTRAAPVRLDLEADLDTEYKKVEVTGQFDYSQEIFIGPRSLIDASGGSGGGGVISLSSAGAGERVGYLVITPFTLSGAEGSRILVNRGWVGQSKAGAGAGAGLEGEGTITGVLRASELVSGLVPPNSPATGRWHSRDLSALAASLNTEPLYLDLSLESGREVSGVAGPVGGQTRVVLRNDHVQYMLTWWGLSAATALLWLKKFVL